jgi:ABC-2 type transport system ATP-binding protein
MSVVLDKFTIVYGQNKAVDGLSAEFPQGSTGLLGVNGAGKSSLIKGLLGLVPIRSGRASILGNDVAEKRKTIRRLVGYMPEDDCLIPGLTGMGMVRYTGELSGMSSPDAIQRAHEILTLVGLGDARYRNVETYSAGMKQRVKLAQAVVHDPKLLFLDEPTSGMDPRGRQEMLDMIQSIVDRGAMSVVLATHILIDVERICGRVVILHRGKVVEQGFVKDLKGSYSGAYSVRVEGDQEAFAERLRKLGCRVEAGGKQLFEVVLPKDKNTDLIFKAAGATRCQVRRLVPSVQSLEDVFVKRVAEGSRADL